MGSSDRGTVPSIAKLEGFPGRLKYDIPSGERNELDLVCELLGRTALGQNLQIFDRPSNGDVQLVAVDQASEGPARFLPLVSDREEVVILGHQNPPRVGGTLQELIIRKFVGLVLESGENVYPSHPKPSDNGAGNVLVHHECNGHWSNRGRSIGGRICQFSGFPEADCDLLVPFLQGERPGIGGLLFEQRHHLVPVVRKPSENGIDFSERQLREVHDEFLSAPAVGNMVCNQMDGFETHSLHHGKAIFPAKCEMGVTLGCLDHTADSKGIRADWQFKPVRNGGVGRIFGVTRQSLH